jgi:hypothetical protein
MFGTAAFVRKYTVSKKTEDFSLTIIFKPPNSSLVKINFRQRVTNPSLISLRVVELQTWPQEFLMYFLHAHSFIRLKFEVEVNS